MIRLTGLAGIQRTRNSSTPPSVLIPALRMLREVRELTQKERDVLDTVLSELELVPTPFIAPDMNKDGVVDAKDQEIKNRRLQSIQEMDNPNSHIDDMDDDTDDHEGEMAKADLLSIHKKAGELYNMIGEEENLEGWIQAKITKAAEYINAVHNNLQYEKTKPSSIGNGNGSPADTEISRMDESLETLEEKAPKGWEATVLKMKKKKEIDNPWALAHWMKSKGYHPKATSKKPSRSKL